MKRIAKITIKHIIDESPDTSFIGEYTDELGPGVIVRALRNFYEKLPTLMERDTNGRFYRKSEPYNLPLRGREYRGFIPYAGGEEKGTRNYYRYGMQDFKRMESLEHGNFCFIGIRAEAEIQTSEQGKDWLINHISSGGLWGIESDSPESYFKEVAQQELAELEKLLLELNFTAEEIKAAFEKAETKTL